MGAGSTTTDARWAPIIGGVAHNFLAPERDQLFLLPPSLIDWLAEDHLAYFVLDAVEEIDVSAFVSAYRVRFPGVRTVGGVRDGRQTETISRLTSSASARHLTSW